MPKYCDSQVLEQNWYNWILSSSVTCLEPYRRIGVLWTKVVGVATHDGRVLKANGRPLSDPSYPFRKHCLALKTPFFFRTQYGQPIGQLTATGRNLLEAPYYRHTLESDLLYKVPIEHFEFQKSTDHQLFSDLYSLGYRPEPINSVSWHCMLEDIKNICNGVAARFHMPSEEEQLDLAGDALIQITDKLTSGRLIYMPGRAPVFNLLTTTAYRIAYSIMNKRNSHKRKIRKLLDDAAAGILPMSSNRLPVSVRS